MPATLTIRDESTSGQTLHVSASGGAHRADYGCRVDRSRVYQEVQDYNRMQPEVYRGLVQPSGAEAA